MVGGDRGKWVIGWDSEGSDGQKSRCDGWDKVLRWGAGVLVESEVVVGEMKPKLIEAVVFKDGGGEGVARKWVWLRKPGWGWS